MYSRTNCVAVQGIEGHLVHIEADISNGLPAFSLVGFLSSEVKEARERVRVALNNSGYHFPPKKITVNLSPADIRKEGTGYDLAIAISVLTAYGFLLQEMTEKILFIGELSLRGEVKPVNGVLPMVYTGLEQGMKYCILSKENSQEAAVVKEMKVIGVSSLKEVVSILMNESLDSKIMSEKEKNEILVRKTMDFSDVKGQEMARRAAEVAAAGMHNFLMIGPPGSGKSMIAGRMAGILPSMNLEEQMEISRIYSVAGMLSDKMPLVQNRPFRSPHHTITTKALVGGGKYPSPGEISLASGGVLFLDELPEFERNALEVLRQPLEERFVNVARLNGSCQFPAKTLLLAAMNPCPCGWFPDRKKCRCNPSQVRRYLGKISQPLLDRIDLCAETVAVLYEDLEDIREEKAESSEEIQKRVEEAHEIQKKRYQGEEINHNAELTPKLIKKYCVLTEDARNYLEKTYHKMEFSARAYHKILKVGRTIADLDKSEKIKRIHIAEAVCYRTIDRKYWGMGEL